MKVFVLSVLSMTLGCAQAIAVRKDSMTKLQTHPFHVVHPTLKDIPRIPTVQFEVRDGMLKARFEVFTPPTQIVGKKTLGPGEFPYQFDVVEVFLQTSGSGQKNSIYYECELTPYNQTYELMIKWQDGKKSVAQDHMKLMKAQATLKKDSWIGEMEIPLKELGLSEKDQLIGNAYVIHGKDSQQVYWSLFLPPQQKADFHKPEHFRPLF